MKIMTKTSDSKHSATRTKAGAFLLGLLAALCALPAASVDIANTPLSVGANVPGNLSLVPSVEFPTLISVANLGDYDPARSYVGYFDSRKCYSYINDVDEKLRHFLPVNGDGPSCAGKLWSGNFMNWAATQTIDPFRSALTGGYRVKDTTEATWIEKAIADRDSTNNFPRRTYPVGDNAAAVGNATPANWGRIRVRIDGLGNKMRFTGGANAAELDLNNPGTGQLIVYNDLLNLTDIEGQPKTSELVYEVSVRVAVCTGVLPVESNCKGGYSGVAKPEGLIQEYSQQLRYSIFGYLNNGDSAAEPDGGVLRANQKFVGPTENFPDVSGAQLNANREWDPVTGILVRSPDSSDAAATAAPAILDSGVINYLNKFGQMETGRRAKSYDNVSELYYAAARYFKSLGNVPEYSALGNSYQLADGFPVITDWKDPLKYRCETNVILGIGDTNTHKDKNLPGPTSGTNENVTKPALVTADTSVNVVADLARIFEMEGLTPAAALTKASAASFNGNNNSAYIAALAYDLHTRDIRPSTGPNPIEGKQTVSTYWVDVVEYGDYKMPLTNQYSLATKYGGFTVPTGYNPDTNVTPLLDNQWWASGEYVKPTGTDFKRPKNFYVAADATKMVESLRAVFAKIIADLRGSGGSFAANSTKLEAGARTFQAQFFTGSWRGELTAYNVDPTNGALSLAWNAGSVFPAWATRKIYVNTDGTTAGYKLFTYSGLAAGQQSALGSQAVVDYLRGDRSNEAPAGTGLRARQSVLGDIINSQPTFVGAPNGRLFYGQDFTGATTYAAYASAQAARTPVVYVGANDGMLHGFNASTGVETYAFVPATAIPGLRDYTSPDYIHRYYVDGETTVADVYTGGAWRTVLVGTLGRGGKGIYALDITNPADVKFLWEKSGTDIAGLGNVLGKPIIAQVGDGDWRVLLGNGPNSTSNDARLITIGIGNGTVTSTVVSAASGNGLSGVNAWSTGATEFVDTVYAGDLQGGLWKIGNLTGTPTVLKLFEAQSAGGVAQPITAAPLVSKNPANNSTWVFVGTGQYLNQLDLASKEVQSWYGLIDTGTAISGRGQLAQTDILSETTAGAFTARVIEDQLVPGARGWYMDLVSPANGAEGERMVVPNFFQGLALIGTTRIPDTRDVCNPSGKGFVMAINPFTGGRLTQSFFDLNGDGKFDNSDLVNGQPVSGIGLPSGPNNPIFIGDIMQTNLDDATSTAIKTNSSVLVPARVSWREIVGN